MSILAIDRGKKRLGLAYVKTGSNVIFPIGGLDNDPDMLFTLAHLVVQHGATIIVVGYPSQVSFVQKRIDAFIKDLGYVVSPDISIVKENEDYSSILAGEKLGNFKKTAAEDSMAAAKILEQYIDRK